jgi:hypothetical protein
MRSYAPKALATALEVALEDHLGGRSLSEAYSTPARSPGSKCRAEPGDGPHWSGDHFDGNPKELERVLAALAHIPADDRRIWREVTAATCDWFMGHARGKTLAEAWASGGTFEVMSFPGCPEKFDRPAQDQLWQQSFGRGEFSIATIFHHAKTLGGWNSSRARWGLGRSQRRRVDLPVAARGVQAAGLKMPRQNMNLGRLAWLYQVQLAIKRPDARDVALIICGFINGASGIAFPKFETIANALHWKPGKTGEGHRRVSVAVQGLARDGFLARSPGNARGAHGRIGPSFALTLPDGMTWERATHDYRAVFGAKVDALDLASSDTGPCGSEPNSKAATIVNSCHSVPVGDGLDQRRDVRVETAQGGNQHLPIPVHLSTYLQEEGAGSRLSSDGASRKHLGKVTSIEVLDAGKARHADTCGTTPPAERMMTDCTSSVEGQGPSPSATPSNTLAWQLKLQRAADIVPYLSDANGCLPADVIAKLREASSKGMDDHLAEVARKLSALRGLGLKDEEIRDHVLGARNHVLGIWSEKRVAKGTLTDEEADDITAMSMPPGGFARGLAAALARRVDWVKSDLRTGKLTPGLPRDCGEPKPAAAWDREMAALFQNPLWSVARTPATNADLVDLCEEFPTVRPNRIRRQLIDAYASMVSPGEAVSLSELLEETRDAIREELENEKQ